MRRVILCVLGAAALAVTAIAILPSLISSDWMRAELGRQLSSATGSSIAFNGPVKFSAFPSLAVVAKDVTLSAEAQGVTAEFAEVTGSVAFSSLWADRLRIEEISVDRPVIILDEKAADETTPVQEGSGEAARATRFPISPRCSNEAPSTRSRSPPARSYGEAQHAPKRSFPMSS